MLQFVRLWGAVALCLAALAFCPNAPAQNYPTKPIRLVVPYPPGGIDVFARVMLPKASEMLGQPMVIDNRAGANGIIGSDNIVHSAPDGHSLLFVTAGSIVIGAVLTKVQPFDVIRDFTPVINLLDPLQILTVHASLPVRSVKELLDYAKRNPGKLSYASSGIGSVFHLNGEQLKSLTGVDIVHVPYKGTAPMATDLLSGRIEVGMPALNNVNEYLTSGKLRVLAVLDSKPYAGLPGVPTLGESVPQFKKAPTWTAIFGPPGLPRPIVERLNGVFLKVLDAPEVRKFINDRGAVIRGGTPEELAATIRSDLDFTANLVKTLGIQPE